MYPTGYKKAARVLLKITFFIYAVMAVCWGLFGVFCFFDERGYYASSFINGLMQLDFFMDAVAVVSMLGVFLMPLPCLILSVTGSVCAAKAAGIGDKESKKILHRGIAAVIIAVLMILIAVFEFYVLANQ